MEYAISVRETYNTGNILGSVRVSFGKSFLITNISIILSERTGDWFVSMPRYNTGKKDPEGNFVYRDVCNPITAEFRAQLYGDILSAFQDHAQLATADQANVPEWTRDIEVKSPKIGVAITPTKLNGGLCAYARIVLDDCFVINNVRLYKGKKGMFLSMPSYKTDQVDEFNRPIYRDICYPLTKEFRMALRTEVMKEYRKVMALENESAEEETENRTAAKSPQHWITYGRHR